MPSMGWIGINGLTRGLTTSNWVRCSRWRNLLRTKMLRVWLRIGLLIGRKLGRSLWGRWRRLIRKKREPSIISSSIRTCPSGKPWWLCSIDTWRNIIWVWGWLKKRRRRLWSSRRYRWKRGRERDWDSSRVVMALPYFSKIYGRRIYHG